MHYWPQWKSKPQACRRPRGPRFCPASFPWLFVCLFCTGSPSPSLHRAMMPGRGPPASAAGCVPGEEPQVEGTRWAACAPGPGPAGSCRLSLQASASPASAPEDDAGRPSAPPCWIPFCRSHVFLFLALLPRLWCTHRWETVQVRKHLSSPHTLQWPSGWPNSSLGVIFLQNLEGCAITSQVSVRSWEDRRRSSS